MDAERALISKIIATGELQTAIAKGVQIDHFADEEARDIYVKILEHSRQYKAPPSAEAFRQIAPKYELLHMPDSLEWICDRFTVLVKRRMANMYVEELAAACDDPERQERIDLEFLEAARQLALIVPSAEVGDFRDMDLRIEEYERMKALGETPGIPFGFPTLDAWTGGMQPHELVTVTAFSGVGKSTLLWQIAFNAYMRGYTPLIISLEMERKALLRRFDAMAAHLSFQKLKLMELDDDEIMRWRERAKNVKEAAQHIPILDKIRHCSPNHVFAESIRHQPDLVLIDYISLMRSDRPSRQTSMWQSLTEVTQDIKQNARTLGIPHIAAAQLNRRGKSEAELENVGYSISVVQDSDIVLALQQDDEMKKQEPPRMKMKLNKNREGRLGEITCIWDHDGLDFREQRPQDIYGRPGSSKPNAESEPAPEEPAKPVQSRPRPRPSATTDRPPSSFRRRRPGS